MFEISIRLGVLVNCLTSTYGSKIEQFCPTLRKLQPRAKALNMEGLELEHAWIGTYWTFRLVGSIWQTLANTVISTFIYLASTHACWRRAMHEKLQALHENHLWDIVSCPNGVKPIGCKCVYSIKLCFDGSLDRYKTRFWHFEQAGIWNKLWGDIYTLGKDWQRYVLFLLLLLLKDEFFDRWMLRSPHYLVFHLFKANIILPYSFIKYLGELSFLLYMLMILL